MKMKVTLKHLIISVALLAVILTLFSSLTTAYQLDRKTLIDNTLETNRVYAKKLANTTDTYLQMMLQTLQVSAKDIADTLDEENYEEKLIEETERLKQQTDTFNSIVIADATGLILATSPQTLNLKGKMLNSPGGMEARREKKPLISKPYLSLTNRLIIFISQPIYNEAGEYLGLVGGSLYLEEKNILYDLLGKHYYDDGSYVFVVDEDGRIIYHQSEDRVNDLVAENPIVQQLVQRESGAQRVVNTKNVEMLAGYAHVPTSNWGIVSQRPLSAAIEPVNVMISEMIIKSVPFLMISIIIILFISNWIALPLQRLSFYAGTSTEERQDKAIENVNAWYYEAYQLKKALKFSLTFLHDKVNHFVHQSTTDHLTKLTNRRTMDEYMRKWIETSTPFSLIIMDIDHFKRVNDTYGHSVGDEVLIFLADKIRSISRKEDICCRYGGEEFVLLLPETNKEDAYQAAERLRKLMESTESPCGDIVTISLGIAAYPEDAANQVPLIELADQCLYEAKRSGRNRTAAWGKG